jgi:hypothetical protein
MDMAGNILHTWSNDAGDSWQYITMGQDGDLLALVKELMLIRMDWDSQVKWASRGRFHHDMTVAENGDIYALMRRDDIGFYYGFPVPLLNDYILILSPDGTSQQVIPLFDVVKKHVPIRDILRIYRMISNPQHVYRLIKNKRQTRVLFPHDSPFDILHNNTLTFIDRDIPGLGQKGDILVSVRQLDLIGILDIAREELRWQWGPGEPSKQHHPTFLDNGNILIFDNGVAQQRSRIVELNPQTEEVVWQYQADQFFSETRGSSQRLPNGNTLITESDSGYVFEVAADGEMVWEFYNPELNQKKRAAIYRMLRIIHPENYPQLKDLQQH